MAWRESLEAGAERWRIAGNREVSVPLGKDNDLIVELAEWRMWLFSSLRSWSGLG